MYPALVNCCTIDWFSEWPAEALHSVALSSLEESTLNLGSHTQSVVQFFKTVHTSVAAKSREYLAVLGRYNYVTPTSYLELLSTFKSVLREKRQKGEGSCAGAAPRVSVAHCCFLALSVDELRDRLNNGLDKLTATANQVATLQAELRDLEPLLLTTQKEVDEMIVRIDADKASASETKVRARCGAVCDTSGRGTDLCILLGCEWSDCGGEGGGGSPEDGPGDEVDC